MGKKWILAVLLLSFHGILLWESARQLSATVDEGSHLATGLYSLQTHDFRLNRESPPLQNLICAAFAAFRFDYVLTFDNESWKNGIWNGSGTNLLKANPQHFQDLLMAGRMGSVCLSIMLCFLVFIWARELWGDIPALGVLAITILEPNLIAHGQLVTTDCSAALTFLATGYVLWRFVKNPSWAWLLCIGASFGLAWYAKHSAFVIIPVMLICFYHFSSTGWEQWKTKSPASAWLPQNGIWIQSWFACLSGSGRGKRFIIAMLLTVFCISIGLFFLWAGYGFEIGDRIEGFVPGSKNLLWEYTRNCILPVIYFLHLDNRVCLDGGENDVLLPLLRTYLPAYSHWAGFAKNQLHLQGGHMGYFMGQISAFGWKSYYPILFVFKTPIVLLVIFALGVWLLFSRRVVLEPLALTILLSIPGIYLMVLVLFNTANIGYRHALPVIPYLLVLCVGAVLKFATGELHTMTLSPDQRKQSMKAAIAIFLLFAGYAGEIVSIHPHYLSFFNGLCGGWKNGRFIAVDSNLDWGQDLLFLKKYQEQKHLKEPHLFYFGPVEYPSYYGISYKKEKWPDALLPGEYVVSATVLQGISNIYLEPLVKILQRREPDEYITPSLFYYHIE